MTQVAFHFGAPDKLAYACRLLRKALRTDARVLVLVTPEDMPTLDTDLWALSPLDFLPHAVREPSVETPLPPPRVLENRSPIVLASDTSADTGDFGVLVNLTDTMPEGFRRFARVIEVVSLDEQDRQHARTRWKAYTQQGFEIVRHDLKLKGAA